MKLVITNAEHIEGESVSETLEVTEKTTIAELGLKIKKSNVSKGANSFCFARFGGERLFPLIPQEPAVTITNDKDNYDYNNLQMNINTSFVTFYNNLLQHHKQHTAEFEVNENVFRVDNLLISLESPTKEDFEIRKLADYTDSADNEYFLPCEQITDFGINLQIRDLESPQYVYGVKLNAGETSIVYDFPFKAAFTLKDIEMTKSEIQLDVFLPLQVDFTVLHDGTQVVLTSHSDSPLTLGIDEGTVLQLRSMKFPNKRQATLADYNVRGQQEELFLVTPRILHIEVGNSPMLMKFDVVANCDTVEELKVIISKSFPILPGAMELAIKNTLGRTPMKSGNPLTSYPKLRNNSSIVLHAKSHSFSYIEKPIFHSIVHLVSPEMYQQISSRDFEVSKESQEDAEMEDVESVVDDEESEEEQNEVEASEQEGQEDGDTENQEEGEQENVEQEEEEEEKQEEKEEETNQDKETQDEDFELTPSKFKIRSSNSLSPTFSSPASGSVYSTPKSVNKSKQQNGKDGSESEEYGLEEGETGNGSLSQRAFAEMTGAQPDVSFFSNLSDLEDSFPPDEQPTPKRAPTPKSSQNSQSTPSSQAAATPSPNASQTTKTPKSSKTPTTTTPKTDKKSAEKSTKKSAKKTQEQPEEEEEETEKEEKEVKASAKKPRKSEESDETEKTSKRKRAEKEQEEEFEEEEEEEEEEVEKPKKRRSSKQAIEDDEDLFDVEVKETPKKSKSSKKIQEEEIQKTKGSSKKKNEVEEEEKPKKSTTKKKEVEEIEEKPKSSKKKEDTKKKSNKKQDEPEEEEEKPKKKSNKKKEEVEKEEDKPKKKSGKKNEEAEEEEKPKKKSTKKKEEEEKPKKKSTKKEEEEEEEKPKKKSTKKKVEEEEEKPKKKSKKEEPEKKKKGSTKKTKQEEEEEEEKPKKKSKKNKEKEEETEEEEEEKKTEEEESDDEFVVEKLLDVKTVRKDNVDIRMFKIRWQGYTSEDDTWDKEEDLIENGYQDKINQILKEKEEKAAAMSEERRREVRALKREADRLKLQEKKNAAEDDEENEEEEEEENEEEGEGEGEGESNRNNLAASQGAPKAGASEAEMVALYSKITGVWGARLAPGNNFLEIAVEWENGQKDYVAADLLKQYRPFMLIDFYQGRLKFVGKDAPKPIGL